MEQRVIDFEYENLDDEEALMEYCEKSDIKLQAYQHAKMKNYVMNQLYLADELSNSDKLLFIIIYDFKSQQKYLPGLKITQEKLANILGKTKSSISINIRNLSKYNLIIKTKDRFREKVLIPNENIKTWGTSIDLKKLSLIEETRKHMASSNKQLSDEYKIYAEMRG